MKNMGTTRRQRTLRWLEQAAIRTSNKRAMPTGGWGRAGRVLPALSRSRPHSRNDEDFFSAFSEAIAVALPPPQPRRVGRADFDDETFTRAKRSGRLLCKSTIYL